MLSCARAVRRCGACGAAHALRALSAALAALATQARAHHARTAPPAPARAAKWLADDDIVRFLQSLPNWKATVEPDSGEKNEQVGGCVSFDADLQLPRVYCGARARKSC